MEKAREEGDGKRRGLEGWERWEERMCRGIFALEERVVGRRSRALGLDGAGGGKSRVR